MIVNDGRVAPIARPAPPTVGAIITENGISFDPQWHSYSINGKRVPSVSRVIREAGLAPDFAGIDPAVLQCAADRGTATHAATELIDADKEPAITEDIRGYLTGYQLWRQHMQPEIIASELMVGSLAHGFAGRLDRVAWCSALRTLIDIKTVVTVHATSVAVQLAGYAVGWDMLHPDQPIEQLCAVQLTKGGDYQLHLFDLAQSKHIFLCALEIIKWKRQHSKS